MTDAAAITRDGARSYTLDNSKYIVAVKDVKKCLACNHWVRTHPGHGPCRAYRFVRAWERPQPCQCPAFSDPEPGRPDQVYTREQINIMMSRRWKANKDRIFLLRDGRYGLWDEFSDPAWLAQPGQDFLPEAPQVPVEPPKPYHATDIPPEPWWGI